VGVLVDRSLDKQVWLYLE